MKAFGSWSVVSLIRLLVQFMWSLTLIPIVLAVAALVFFPISGAPLPIVGLSVNIDAGNYLQLDQIINTDSVIFGPQTGIKTFYLSFADPSVFTILLGLIQLCIPLYVLYALTVLKRPLNEMALNHLYKPENGKDFRQAAILLLAAAPLKFGIDWLAKYNLELILETSDVAILPPSFNFTLLFGGLICYLFAEILNQATTMFREQKLTV